MATKSELREIRWTHARAVISAGVDLLSKTEDSGIRSRFNRTIDQINKQMASGLSDRDLVLNAIRSGSTTVGRLREETLFDDDLLSEILEDLENLSKIRRVDRGSVEVRDIRTELRKVQAVINDRGQGYPVNSGEIQTATGFSRRRVQELLTILVKENKIARTRAGFRIAGNGAQIIHPEDCLCRPCLTPGNNGGFNQNVAIY